MAFRILNWSVTVYHFLRLLKSMKKKKNFSFKEYHLSKGRVDMILMFLMQKNIFNLSLCTGTSSNTWGAYVDRWPKHLVWRASSRWWHWSGNSEFLGLGVEGLDPSNIGLLLVHIIFSPLLTVFCFSFHTLKLSLCPSFEMSSLHP